MACSWRNSEKAEDVQRGLQVGHMNLKWAKSLGCVLSSEDGMVFGDREVQSQKTGQWAGSQGGRIRPPAGSWTWG